LVFRSQVASHAGELRGDDTTTRKACFRSATTQQQDEQSKQDRWTEDRGDDNTGLRDRTVSVVVVFTAAVAAAVVAVVDRQADDTVLSVEVVGRADIALTSARRRFHQYGDARYARTGENGPALSVDCLDDEKRVGGSVELVLKRERCFGDA